MSVSVSVSVSVELASLALSLAFVCGSCNVYDTTLLADRRGAGDSSGGSAPASGAGGAPSAGAAARGGREDTTSGGNSGGDSGGRAFGGSAGSDSVGGEGGETVGSTGGASAFGGSASGGVVNSGGTVEAGAAGASNSGGGGGGGATNGGTSAGGLGGGGLTGGSGGSGATEGGSAGTGGAGEACSGCARLSVPLTATSDQARFVIRLAEATDLSTATVALHVIKRQGTGGSLRLFIQSGGPDFSLAFSSATLLQAIGSSVQTVTWNIANADTSLDKKAVERVGIEIAGVGGSAWANPTILYVDRVDVSGSTPATASFSFETAASVYTTPTTSGPRERMWLNSHAEDTNVSGAALGWLGP